MKRVNLSNSPMQEGPAKSVFIGAWVASASLGHVCEVGLLSTSLSLRSRTQKSGASVAAASKRRCGACYTRNKHLKRNHKAPGRLCDSSP